MCRAAGNNGRDSMNPLYPTYKSCLNCVVINREKDFPPTVRLRAHLRTCGKMAIARRYRDMEMPVL